MTDKDPHPQKTPDKAKGPGTWIALAFITARDALARCLLSLKLGPDTLTAAGLLFTIAAAVFLALGAGDAHHTFAGFGQAGWRLWAVIFFILSAAADMLDGAMARIGGVGAKKLENYGAAFLEVINGEAQPMHKARRKLAGREAGNVYDQLLQVQADLARGEQGTDKPLSCSAAMLAKVAQLRSADSSAIERLLGDKRAERFGPAFLDVLRDAG